MTNDLDALKSALQATPAPDPQARAAALALAMENFDRRQGSTDPVRLSQDRPSRAGFLNGVRAMLTSLKSRPYLAATTSTAALLIGVFVALPQLQTALQPTPKPTVTAAEVAPPARPVTPPVTIRDQTADLGRADDALSLGDAAKPAAPEMDTSTNMPAEPAPAPEPMTRNKAEVAQMDERAAIAGAIAAPDASAAQRGIVWTDQAMGIAPGATTAHRLANGQIVVLHDAPLTAPVEDTEAFATAAPNPVKVTAEEAVSTFSIDVDTASYAVIRSSLNMGQLPPPQAVRIEEMVNYFPYAYPAPTGDAPFANHVTVMPTPWNPDTRLVHIALQGQMPATEDRPPLNLVFLIDTSGSMDDFAKLPLLKQSFTLMLAKLRPEDRVAIVAYAGSAGTVLPPTAASDRPAIQAALNNLAAGGSTAGAQGLALAYQVAESMASEGEVSRVILATDGDFNVGIDNPDDLKTYIATQRDKGTYLSVLGFGRGNLDDATMQALAQNGNGTAAYIDTLAEAQKVLVDQLTGALFPIANDVKIQVEWNPSQVAEYRLIGYETRELRREDFNNDRIDAGEIGAGLQVTALYEITAPGSPALLNDPLRYGAAPVASDSPELGFLRLRYKTPGSDMSNLIETPVTPGTPIPDDARFAAAIAGFGQLLQSSPYLGTWGYDQAIALATAAKGPDEFGYRAEAVTLMRLAQSLSN